MPEWEMLQTGGASGVPYAAPSDGVLTTWSFEAGAQQTMITLRVFRPTAIPHQYTVIADASELKTIAASSGLSTFPTRIPVRAGDIVGVHSTVGECASLTSNPADTVDAREGIATAVGTAANYGSASGFIVDISAQLEPDCDSDGFGDETQDQELNSCPPPPQTTITKRPKDKTKKKQATFEFTANEPGATFECSLDGGPFAVCSSPDTLKVKKGKHTFAVRAKDAGDNIGSPATDDWKVKKRKKK